MADPLTDPSVFADYWRPLSGTEVDAAQGLILVASALIRRAFPTVDANIANGKVDQALVDYVIVEMVKSAVESGNRAANAKSESQTVGPYSTSISYEAASRIALDDELIVLLLPAGSPTVGTFGSARLGTPSWCTPPTWPAA